MTAEINSIVKIKRLKGGSFKSMNLDSQLYFNIDFNNPTPIQRKTLPFILQNISLMAIARTGSGKTLCYLIPAVQKSINGFNSFIFVPTKELVFQVKKFLKKLTFKIKLKGKIIVSTLNSKIAKNEKIDLLVFDEIDRILEEKNLRDHYLEINKVDCQKIYFSATLPNEHLPNVKIIKINSAISEKIQNLFFYVPQQYKENALLVLLKKFLINEKKTIIFTNTKYSVDLLLSILDKYEYRARGIYSNMDDSARKSNFSDFFTNKANILIVTDVASRGLDIPYLDFIVSYDLCDEKTFLHRVGRIRELNPENGSINLVSYSDIYQFFNIRETYLKNQEIGKIPQEILDSYDLEEFKYLKIKALRGFNKCLEFRNKVSIPKEYKEEIQKINLHSIFQKQNLLKDMIKDYNKIDKKEKKETIKKDYKDVSYIPYTKNNTMTHTSAFGKSKDDYVKERREKIRYKKK